MMFFSIGNGKSTINVLSVGSGAGMYGLQYGYVFLFSFFFQNRVLKIVKGAEWEINLSLLSQLQGAGGISWCVTTSENSLCIPTLIALCPPQKTSSPSLLKGREKLELLHRVSTQKPKPTK